MNYRTSLIVSISVLFGFFLIFFYQPIFLQRVFYVFDLSYMTLPNLVANAVIKNQGVLPLWNPWVKFGYPMSAESEMGSLYPPAFLINLPMDYGQSFTIYILFHYLLAIGGTWFYCRELGLSHAGRTVAALIFVFSGSFVAQTVDLPLITTFAWAPIVLAFQLRAINKRSVGWAAVAGLFLGIQLLGAHPQMCLYLGLMTLPHGIIGVKDGFKRQNLLWAVSVLAVLYLVGFSIGAPQLLYNYDLLQFTARGIKVPYDFLASHSLPPLYFIQALIPNFFGSEVNYVGVSWFTTMHLFWGVSAIGLIIIGWQSKKRYSSYFSFCLLFFIILALGRYSYIYKFVSNLPGFNIIRAPARMLLPASLAIGVLAGMGIDALFEGNGVIKKWSKRLIALYLTIFAFQLSVGLAAQLGISGNYKIQDIYRKLIDMYLEFEQRGLPWYLIDTTSDAFRQRVSDAMADMAHSAMIASFFSALVVLWWSFYNRFSAYKIYPVILIIIAASELWTFESKVNRYQAPDYYQASPIVGQIEGDGDYPPRIFPLTLDDMLHPDLSNMQSSVPVLYGIASTKTYLSMTHVRLEKYLRYLSEATPKRLAMADVKYIVSTAPLPDAFLREARRFKELKKNLPKPYLDYLKGINLDEAISRIERREFVPNTIVEVKNDGTRYLYEITDRLPRAYFAKGIEIIPDPDKLLMRIDQEDFTPAETALLEEKPELVQGIPMNYSQNEPVVKITHYDSRRIDIKVMTPYNGMLVLSDMYHPGWSATVNGQEKKIYQTNYLFRGLYLGKGEHEISFSYYPKSFYTGLWFAIGSLLSLLVWSCIKITVKWKNAI